jgi:hypothetical protein
MATVIGSTKAEFDKAEMTKRSGGKAEESKPKFAYPHYGVGDIVITGQTGHMMVTEHDKKGKGYFGHSVNEYGESSNPKIEKYASHEDLGTGAHHLYAKVGDYPTRETNEMPSHKDTSK